MRKSWIALAILPLAACTQGVTFELESTMDAQTRGVALFDWSNTGIAGMFDQTCAFDFQEGVVLGDVVDLPGTDDRVVDGDGAQALVTSDGGVWSVNDWGDAWSAGAGIHVLDATFAMDGVAALGLDGDTCVVEFTGFGTTTALEGFDCASAVIDGGWEQRGAFVADGTTVAHVDTRGVRVIEANADLLAWDDATGTLVIAKKGGEHIRGIDADGNTQWTVRVDGAVASVDDLGWEGQTVATFEREDGLGEVIVLDNTDGTVRADHVTPGVATVTTSPNGDAVALETDGEVHFYEVDPRNAAIEVPGVQPERDVAFGD